MGETDHRPHELREQARLHAGQARAKMDRRRDEQAGGVSGWVAERAGQWDLSGQDEQTMQRQQFFWNTLVDYWFRMEMDGWENVPETPVLLVGIHSGAPFVWDAWTVGAQWWRGLGPGRPVAGNRPCRGTAHDPLMAVRALGPSFGAMGVPPAAPDSIAAALAEGRDVAV